MNKEDRKGLAERLRKEADWLVSCACGNIPDDARLWIDAADEITRLRRELEEARRALRQMRCPRPCNHQPEDLDAGDCIDAGECGCIDSRFLSTLRAEEEGR